MGIAVRTRTCEDAIDVTITTYKPMGMNVPHWQVDVSCVITVPVMATRLIAHAL